MHHKDIASFNICYSINITLNIKFGMIYIISLSFSSYGKYWAQTFKENSPWSYAMTLYLYRPPFQRAFTVSLGMQMDGTHPSSKKGISSFLHACSLLHLCQWVNLDETRSHLESRLIWVIDPNVKILRNKAIPLVKVI